jgi:uncharacterized Ntn-hydrolase superfamily protein
MKNRSNNPQYRCCKGNPLRPISTYSIVAREPHTGQMGIAVQSHWFSVGQSVAWAQSGVGAVVTQAFADPSYGPRGLELMRSGKSPAEALKELLAQDTDPEVRQVGIVDVLGRAAAHTGSRNTPAAGHVVGEQFTIQANLMEKESVLPAMKRAFEGSPGELSERFLLALEAAEAEGGDIRGRQSAAMLIVAGEDSGKVWEDRLLDLRVEDHPYPVQELRRLVNLQRMYDKMNEGDQYLTKDDLDKAVEVYESALEMAPDEATNGEVAFWTGISLAGAGRVEQALPYLVRAQRVHAKWAELVERLPVSGMLPDDQPLLEKLKGVMVSSSPALDNPEM